MFFQDVASVLLRLIKPIILPLLTTVLCACTDAGTPVAEITTAEPEFLGADACQSCHVNEFASWSASHHAKSMAHASAETVLGDFSASDFSHLATQAGFDRVGNDFYVTIDNALGEQERFRVAYTFGVEPLQQYLVEFDDGRVQTLPVAWDSRPQNLGGQRWFHIYPVESIDSNDPLHWTGREQNWNFMCAECHSTNLSKNYNAETDTYSTTWSEINVGCEACHGPASEHVAQAEAFRFDARFGLAIDLDDSGRAVWEMDSVSGIAARTESRMTAPKQPEACGRCHSRRASIVADYAYAKNLLATHSLSLLDAPLYFPDGQIREEVYVYGSFVQSRMYQAGVSCSDCHEPHSAKLVSGPDPNQVCATCHLPERFANVSHHQHAGAAPGCVDCHMPSRTYMVVDARRDHGFRIPRPDLSLSTGSPNVCTQCHVGESAEWAATNIVDWFGAVDDQHFAKALHAARSHQANGNDLLQAVAGNSANSGIVRASALSELRPPLQNLSMNRIRDSLLDSDGLIRIGALRALTNLPPDLQVQWASPLLADALLSVRIEAASILSPLREQLPAETGQSFARALDELRRSHEVNIDRPESRASLASLAADRGDLESAESAFREVLEIEPAFSGARINLADLYRRLGRDSDAEQLLLQGIALREDDPALRHALGLLFVRAARPEEALSELSRATEIDPENPRYAYVYAVALNSLGQPDNALARLRSAAAAFPADFDIQWALATMLRDRGESEAARGIARELVVRYPDIAAVRQLLQSL